MQLQRMGLVFSTPAILLALLQSETTGRIDDELIVNPVGGQIEPLTAAGDRDRALLGEAVTSADRVWSGTAFTHAGRNLRILIVERPAARLAWLHADMNINGKFEPGERWPFQPTDADADAYGDVLLQAPMKGQSFATYPIRLRLKPQQSGGPMLLQAPFAYVSGVVIIGGKPTRIWVQYDGKKGGAWPDYGWQGMDVNGDGRIQTGGNSPEYTFAKDESVIFRVNGRDVSIAAVDLQARTLRIREHVPGANGRIGLSTGSEIPDFGFRDLQGKERRLSDFRGKFVLLDFWGTWCGPCVRILPELQKAHEEYGGRGVVFLGLPSHEANHESVRALLSDHKITFLQAHPESVKDLVEKRFRINMFPTHVLLDPEGRIVETGESLRPPQLAATLERLLR